MDTGYPKDGLGVEACEKLLGIPCREVVRVESLAQSLLPQARSVTEFLDDLGQRLRQANKGRFVAFKTIAAYRCGLSLATPRKNQLIDAFDRERRRHDQDGHVRLTERRLFSELVFRTLPVARELEVPVQFHTGFGDSDLDLRRADPLLLRPILERDGDGDVPIVLLHAGYPFVRNAGILAGLYPNVYVDLSLAIPLTGHGGRQVVLELLEQAPVSKVMYGSDASIGPELFAWGAICARAAVGSALDELTDAQWLTSEEALRWARRIFSDNARALYRLEEAIQ